MGRVGFTTAFYLVIEGVFNFYRHSPSTQGRVIIDGNERPRHETRLSGETSVGYDTMSFLPDMRREWWDGRLRNVCLREFEKFHLTPPPVRVATL